nr:9kDa protein [Agapanthus velarivirus]QVY19214.1 9kDa protein [Agapanthus velarivirus]QVY47410.1 9kDa protein [Agapanthus velarivirus]
MARTLEESNEDGGKSYIVIVVCVLMIIALIVIAVWVNIKICKEDRCALADTNLSDETQDFTKKNIPVIRMQCNHTESQRRQAK